MRHEFCLVCVHLQLSVFQMQKAYAVQQERINDYVTVHYLTTLPTGSLNFNPALISVNTLCLYA